NGLSDRIHHLFAVSGHRSGGSEHLDVDGHDHALADDHLAAVQDHAVRPGGWLVADYGHPGREFCGLAKRRLLGLKTLSTDKKEAFFYRKDFSPERLHGSRKVLEQHSSGD